MFFLAIKASLKLVFKNNGQHTKSVAGTIEDMMQCGKVYKQKWNALPQNTRVYKQQTYITHHDSKRFTGILLANFLLYWE